jgi:nucleoid-associated protein YgaU
VLVPSLPDLKIPIATAAPNPTLGQRHAIGSSVYVKRSNGEETIVYVKEYDAEKALYTVELERVGSGKAKTYRDKDLRASKNMLEGLLYSVRATLFTLQAAQEPEPAEEAAQAVEEAARAAAEETAQAAEAARAAAEEAVQAEAASVAAEEEAAQAAEEEAAQAAEADRVQVLEPTVPPTAVRTVDELRNRRSTFIFPRNAVPATTFTNVNDVTRGQKVRL